MIEPWGGMRIGSTPRFRSDISDDHSPYEFSLALFQGEPEVRFLIEAQARYPSLRDYWDAGMALSGVLEEKFGASLARLRKIEDLYRPGEMPVRFAAWHAVCVRRSGPLNFKIYLNPQVRGERQAAEIVKESLARLGLSSAIGSLPTVRAPDQIKYFSLDLSPSTMSRVKVYSVYPQASPDDIESIVRTTAAYVPGQASEFCRHMAVMAGPFNALPVQVCLAFVEGSKIPMEATIHFPIRSYVTDDLAARERILAYLDPDDAALYAKAIEAFAHRPLEAGSGLHSYVSLRMQQGKRSFTVYLSTELYQPSAPA
ncbi:MAG TPA: tryptophan dimethylallyltransferase family protein [Candidatus Nanopelagicales bacterium]|nr:tryptophan dimethylallyltransferase family protein [Candidatus Nanopelagicales bacterium]